MHDEKTMSHGAAGIARSRHQHRERPAFAVNEMAHQARHEARPEILKGKRRAVEQFEDVQPRRE